MNKIIKEYGKFLVKILQEDIKDYKIIMEKQEVDEDHKHMVVTFLFTPDRCTRKIQVTFDYDELSKKITCSRTTLDDEE